MSRLHLRLSQKHAKLIRDNLSLHIMTHGVHTQIEKWGCYKNGAVYVNNGRGGMFKLTAEDLLEVPNGTDDVLMSSRSIQPWPTIAGNEDRIQAIAKHIGYKGGRVDPDSILCKHFTGMFEEDSMATEQYQQLLLLRFLSLFFGNTIAIRPILMSLGEQGSGKSTLFEKLMWLLEGMKFQSGALPTKMRDFVTAITNSQARIFDNIDGTDFRKGDAASYIDLMCKCATGGEIDIAQLYQTNVNLSFSLRCDLFLTARVNPFPSHRSDLSRRMLYFPIRKPEPEEYVTVDKMKRDLAADAEEMKLELLVRLHYMVKALVATEGQEYRPVTEMHDFENWTMRIASFEKWPDEMTAIWQGSVTEYRQRVTEDSPLIDVVRRWIGSKPENIGRKVRVSEMYKELAERYGRSFTTQWRSSAIFGKQIKSNLSALRVLGIQKGGTHGYPNYAFTPPPEGCGECAAAYRDSMPNWKLQGDAEPDMNGLDVEY